MHRLNRYVFDNQDQLVNLTTKKRLPKSASEDELRENFFLDGQESESLEEALFNPKPKRFEIKIIPTWECNLRCTHCFVLHELVKKDSGSIDNCKFLGFLRSYLSEYPSIETGRFQFIGGEASLRAKSNLDLMNGIRMACEEFEIECQFATTTNCFELNDDIIQFYSQINDITVSLDGPKIFHDKQRKSLEGEESPFDKTVSNIKTLIGLGMRDAIRVQASLPDECINEEIMVPFYKTLLMAGVKFERIIFGSIVPTEHHPKMGEKFLESNKFGVFPVPCCKYRLMHDFVVDSTNRVYCDYFDADSKNLLGSLTDTMESIRNAHIASIRKNMEVLNDEKCKECPVIGLCWGWCCNTNKTMKPSEHCDRDGLLARVKANAEKGNLVSFYKDPRKNDVTKERLKEETEVVS